ncbi:MAG: putative Acyl transferase/acyl hydrolase/lysophospholipase/patatin [Bacteroidetes bacterium]|nr:MAG: putative Acyl transferase/acyl hydrolase/lysophospholipase/patatin [Bacteroidota bacterium]
MNLNIAFEGGGGKGAAYIDVAKAIEDLLIRQRITGFSGSSAGALTALAMAVGISSKDLRLFTEYGGFERVLPKQGNAEADTGPSIRAVIQTLGAVQTGKLNLSDDYRKYYSQKKDLFAKIMKGIEVADEVIAGALTVQPIIPLRFFAPLALGFQPIKRLKDWVFSSLGDFEKKLDKNTFANLLTTGGMYRGDLLVDTLYDALTIYGINNGLLKQTAGRFGRIYDRNDQLVELHFTKEQIQVNNSRIIPKTDTKNPYGSITPGQLYGGKPIQSSSGAQPAAAEGVLKLVFSDTFIDTLTFQNLYDLTGKDLFVTGANLWDGNIYFFSKDTTPDFPVLEAVAISMHIPLLWSPVFVSYKSKGVDYTGFYVDGGLYNNFPIRIFTAPGNARGDLHLLKNNLIGNGSKAIGFCLDGRDKYLSASFPLSGNVISAILGSVLDRNTFEKYFEGTAENRHVWPLVTEGLSTYNFSPKEGVLSNLSQRNTKGIVNFLKSHL